MQATSEERNTVIKINNKSVQSRNFNGFIGKSDPELTFHQRFLKRVQIRLPRIRSQSFATGMTQKPKVAPLTGWTIPLVSTMVPFPNLAPVKTNK